MLRPEKNDRSGIGVHYVDAFLKPLKGGVVLPDGRKLAAKRRGLKITLIYDSVKADGLMRRVTVSKDPVIMLQSALAEAGIKLGLRVFAEHGSLMLEKLSPAMPRAGDGSNELPGSPHSSPPST